MENSLSFRETVDLLLRHRILVGATSFGAVLLATAMALFQTPIYESTAVLLIKLGREMISRPAIGDRETLVNRENSIINSEIQILRSESVIDETIQTITLERLYPGLVEEPPVGVPIERVAANRFRKNFIVSAVAASDVLKVSFRHTDPETAAATVNELVEQFTKKHLETFSGNEATAFLEKTVLDYRAGLERLEGDLRDFRTVHTAFTVDDPGALLMEERTRLSAALEQARERVAAIRRRLSVLSPVDTAQLRNDRAELASQQEEQARLEAALARTQAEFDNLAALQQEYRKRVRDRDKAEDLYRIYSRKLADARLSFEMDEQKIANISVIQAGVIPIKPIRPQKRLYVAVGAMAGVALGCLAAFLVESLRRVPGPGIQAGTGPETQASARA